MEWFLGSWMVVKMLIKKATPFWNISYNNVFRIRVKLETVLRHHNYSEILGNINKKEKQEKGI